MFKTNKIHTFRYLMPKRLAILISIIAILSSCSKKRDVNDVNIRISNISNLNFENIMVGTSSVKTLDYGNLESGMFSEYKNFERAYRIAFVDLRVNGQTYLIEPVDFIGETPLSDGNYTYELDLTDREDGFIELVINLIED